MPPLVLSLTVALAMWSGPSQGASILAVLPLWARSHHLVFQPILKTLANAGHQVLVYSPFPLDTPHKNYRDIHLRKIITNGSEIDELILRMIDKSHFRCMADLKLGFHMFNTLITNEEIKELLVSGQTFDLIISEVFTGQEFIAILGHIFKAPIIAVQAFQTHCILNSVSGNSLSLAHIPDVCHPFSTRMTLSERILNSFWVLRNLYSYYDYLLTLEQMMGQHFFEMPPLPDLLQNVSLTFFNGHRTSFYPEPLTPNMVPVGGIHLQPQKALPQELATYFDSSPEGVIYLSLGTYIPDDLMPQMYFETFINAFKKLPQKILWKTRKQAIEGLPSNVKLIQWAPQQDILAHPNCVLFVTHGGQLSQIEAIHSAVPVISIPYLFDQHRNAKFYDEMEIGISLHLHNLTTENIFEAIQTVLKTPKYKENMKKMSMVFKDRPMTPEETVLFWTEYVLRHKGAYHLKPASALMPLYQLALLDVIAVIFIGVVSIILICYFIILRIVFRSHKRIRQLQTSKKVE